MPVTIDNPSTQIRVRKDFLTGSTGETTANKFLWVADQPCQINYVNGLYSVTGSTTVNIGKTFIVASAAVTVGSAVPVLTAAMNYAGGSANLPLTGTVVASTTLNQLAIGDAITLIWGTASNLPPIGMIEVVLQRL